MSDQILNTFQIESDKTIKHLESEFAKLQAGRANSAMVEGLIISVYGAGQPLKNIATISIPDPQTIQIQPWDKGVLASVEKSIQESNLGINPNNDGICIRLNIPQPTEERRRELVKLAKSLAEESKIVIRKHRQNALDSLKKLELPEDESHTQEGDLKKKVDDSNHKIEETFKNKEKDILTV